MEIEKIKKKLDKLTKKIQEKFENHIKGIALLPPPSISEDMNLNSAQLAEMKQKIEELKSKHNILILMDDSDSKEMGPAQLKAKLNDIIQKIGKEVDENFSLQIMLLSELWESCLDGKKEFVDLIAMSAIIFDKGILSALKITNLHMHMVTNKFDKYIVSYVLAGSLTTGKATEKSDIDVFLVVDDTDVKRMPRYELKEKLDVIIHQLGFEAKDKTGIQRPLNIQTYLLSDFWEGLKDANPVYFTLLRDGIPLHDRGMFVPWKQLLKSGKIKPSQEAVEMLMHAGEAVLSRVDQKLRDIAMEDFFWAIHSPTQAALMLFGLAPPAPSETLKVMKEVFIEKEKLLEKEYLDILEHVMKVRKDFEHGDKTSITGKEVEDMRKDCKKYLDRIKKLFSQIDQIKIEENSQKLFDTTESLTRDCLLAIGHKSVKEEELLIKFQKELIETGILNKGVLTKLKRIFEAKDKKKLTTDQMTKIKKDFAEVFKELLEFIEKKKGKDIEKIKINVRSKDKTGEIVVFDKEVFIILFNQESNRSILKAELSKKGSFKDPKETTVEEYEKKIKEFKVTQKPAITKEMFESFSDFFGENTEVFLF